MKSIRFKFVISFILLATAFVKSNPIKNGNEPRQAVSQFAKTKLNFTENKGQVMGYDELPHPEVKFVFQQGATQLFLLENGIAYQFTKIHYPEGYQELINEREGKENYERLEKLQKQIRTETYRMDMVLIGAKIKTEITTEGKSNDYSNYYNHNALAVYHYSKITYHEIYPGIDWVIYTRNGEVKYDFVVRPGANPDLIKMQFKHQEDLSINLDGGFTLKNTMGSITEKKPQSFQNEKTISTQFVLSENIVTFQLETYDSKQTLTIDPAILWATYYGGTGNDYCQSCTNDASGNVYLAGYSNTSSSIASGGHQNILGGSNDAFLVKFNNLGIRQWATYYGGSFDDGGYACVTDFLGNVYLAGKTISNSDIASGGHQNTIGGGYDAFLVKFNSNGIRQWATYYGGSGGENGYSCATDATGNIYLTGITQSFSVIASGGHQNTFSGGTTDAFLVKFNTNGVRQWATYYGGIGGDYGYSCAADVSGNVFLTGYTLSNSNIASSFGHQSSYGGGTGDAFLVKFNSSGMRQWATYYGGTGFDYGYSCTTDISGNVFIGGHTTSNAGIASGGYQNTYGGGYDAYIVKFNSNGVRQWASYYGSQNGADQGLSCVTDALGNIFLAGLTTSSISIASGGVQNAYGGGTNDAYLVKFNGSGALQWATYYGGIDDDQGNSCAIDQSGNVFLAGYTASSSSIASNGHQNTYGGGTYDAFLVKICNGPEQPSAIIGNSVVCQISSENYSVTIDTSVSGYAWIIPSGWSAGSWTNSAIIYAGSSGILSVTASNSCGLSPMQTLSITVNSNPTISVNSGTICSGQSFTISASGANTYTYSSGSNVVSPIINTTYTVSGTSSEGCVAMSAVSSSIIVEPLPIISVNSGTICSGQSFTISASGANTYTYSSGSNVVSPIINTTYTVSGTSSEGCVAMSAASSSIIVEPLPIISVNNGSICSGQSFTISASGANTYTYAGGSNVVSPTTNTSYSVSGTSTAGCLSQFPANSSVSVFQLPTVSISAISTVICLGEEMALVVSGAVTYTWNSGVSDTSLNVSPIASTNYSVAATDTNGCENTSSFALQVDECTGIEKMTLGENLIIYPNPSIGFFTLQRKVEGIAQVVVYTSIGKIIMSEIITEQTSKIDLSEYSNGIYFFELKTNGQSIKTRIIKQ